MIFSRYDSDAIGIDLGTAYTRFYVNGRGIVLNEPSFVALDNKKGEIVAVGNNAVKLLGRNIDVLEGIYPLINGVIADYISAEHMLKYYIEKVCNKSWLSRPNVVVGMPPGITGVEERAIRQTLSEAGAGKISLVANPILAGIGSGLDVFNGSGMMIIDVGDGTTDIAILSYGGMVASKSIKIGGNKLNQDLVQYIRKEYNLLITNNVAEEVKKRIGTAFLYNRINDKSMDVAGKDLITGETRTVKLNSKETEDAFNESIGAIYEATKLVMTECPPELAWDVMDKGIIMTGGGSLLDGLSLALGRALGVSVQVGENPENSVSLGTGILLKGSYFMKVSKVDEDNFG